MDIAFELGADHDGSDVYFFAEKLVMKLNARTLTYQIGIGSYVGEREKKKTFPAATYIAPFFSGLLHGVA